MLELSDDQGVMELAWEQVEQKTELPDELNDFFDQRGTMHPRPGCRRAYLRFYLRGQAILERQGKLLGVYTTDASRQGIGFLSPLQLLPKERCRIQLPKTKEFHIEVVRCRRISEACYECGAMFVIGTLNK